MENSQIYWFTKTRLDLISDYVIVMADRVPSESTLKILEAIQSTLRITNRLAAGSQNHEFSIKNNTFRPVSVLFRRSTYSREGTDVNLGQIFKI